jgi:UDP-N-acetylglucosamine 2-epimerase (non-hydrolysing)
VPDDQIFFVGNTMIDTLFTNMDRLHPAEFWNALSLRPHEYIVLTLHRPANVDDPDNLKAMLAAVANACRTLPVVFPVHPRTAKSLEGVAIPPTIHLVDSQPYLAFIHLVKHAKAVITDSGGITEETTVMGVPCLTMRDTTERPETVTLGTNVIVGTDPMQLRAFLDQLFEGNWKRGAIPEKWDGKTGERIVEILEKLCGTLRG